MDPWLSDHYAGTGADDAPHKIRRGGGSTPLQRKPAIAPASVTAPPVRVKNPAYHYATPRRRTRPWAWFGLGVIAAFAGMLYLMEIGVIVAGHATP